LKILKIILDNFMRQAHLEIDANGNNVNAWGNNGTGKTTIADAFMFLLFDRDSHNRAKFDIGTLDENNNPIPHLDATVEAVIDIDGKELTLKKVYKQKWVKPKGSLIETFTGNYTTSYYINNCPVKESDYKAKIKSIAPEHVFKALTDPSYFTEQMHWKEKRDLLLEVCGDICDGDVIAKDPSLAHFTTILNGKSIEKHYAYVSDKIQNLKKRIEDIPARISENQKNMPDTKDIDFDKVSEDIAELEASKKVLITKQADLNTNGPVAQKKVEAANLKSEMLTAINNFDELKQSRLEPLRQQYNDCNKIISETTKSINELKNSIEDKNAVKERALKAVEILKAEWASYKAIEFDDLVCPTCGREYDEGKLSELRNAFADRKEAKRLEINTAGKKAAMEAAVAETEIASLTAKILELEKVLKDNKVLLEKTDAEGKKVGAEKYQDSEDYKLKYEQYQVVLDEIRSLAEGDAENSKNPANVIEDSIKEIDLQIKSFQEKLALKEKAVLIQFRIDELKKEEKDISKEYEKLQGELYTINQFIITKVNMIEDKINSSFKIAKFKLFKDVVSTSEEKECCEVMHNGVSNSINTATKINIGLDIINKLSEFYNFSAPIFIDNAESVTEFIPVNAQVFKLIVSKPDETLRIEVEDSSSAERMVN
jgi:DNA repair exonuclease SbcCD ATPase subunit